MLPANFFLMTCTTQLPQGARCRPFSERGKNFFLQDTASELVAWLERASDREQASFKTRAVRYCITACTVVLLWWSGLHFVG